MEVTPAEEDDAEQPSSSASTTEAKEPTELAVEPQASIEKRCEPAKIIGDFDMPEWDWADHCDEEFAGASKAQSDWFSVVTHNNGQWIGYDHCAPEDNINAVPSALHHFMRTCENTETRQASPATS